MKNTSGMTMVAKVFLAVPCYGDSNWEVFAGVSNASAVHDVDTKVKICSLLCYNFNMLWAEALNGDFDYFAMCHSDVAAENGWLDKLIYLLTSNNLDLLSAVIPIKDNRKLTSTGIIDEELQVRVLSIEDVVGLPPVFTRDNFAYGYLAVNTGLWVCDLQNKVFSGVCFETVDSILLTDEGLYKAVNIPEDWFFSYKLAKLGARVGATSAISLAHYGRGKW